MYEVAIHIVQKYIDEHLFEPGSNWPNNKFADRSYSRWAAYEIQNLFYEEMLRLPQHITGRSPIVPVDIILGFMIDIEYFSDISESRKIQPMFSIARDTAEEILYLFL